jgi:uroporphyrinogen-III decarboxylase
MSKTPQDLYQERERRVLDALLHRKPDCVPVILLFGAFASRYAGISRKDELYDLKKSYEANLKATLDFAPEMASAPLTFGSVLEALDYKQLKWSGYGLPDDYGYQYVEGEYMQAEEYDAFLYDPSDYVMRRHWPRTLGKLGAFSKLPPIRSLISYFFGLTSGFIPLSTPQGFEALEALKRASEESVRSIGALQTFVGRLAESGFPMFFASGTQAPYDTLGDYFRGTKGIFLDMYRQPAKLVAACEKLLPVMLETAIPAAKMSGNPRVLIPLHKGSDNFMSLEQFKRFYWPTFRQLLITLVDEGLTPVVLVEGPYTSRLETMADVPKGKIIYWFENVDMVQARKILGGKVCIMGNVPMSLLATGTVNQVKEYCRKLLDLMGRDGGYIMSSGAVLDDAKTENVRALVDFTRQWK